MVLATTRKFEPAPNPLNELKRMNVVRFCRENRYAVYLLTAFLAVAGVVAVFQLPNNIYPELNFPRIVVLAHSGDLAPDAMLLTVTRPIEESVRTTPGVRR